MTTEMQPPKLGTSRSTIKWVSFMSEESACYLDGHAFHGMISITEPGRTAAIHEDKWGALLRLRFHDLDKQWQNYKLFNQHYAERIVKWLKENEDILTTVHVHCAQGISRSAAVAKFIAEVYELEFNDSYDLYNKLVYAELRKYYYGYDPVADSPFRDNALGNENNKYDIRFTEGAEDA